MATRTRTASPTTPTPGHRTAVGASAPRICERGFPYLAQRFTEKQAAGRISIEPFVVTEEEAKWENLRSMFNHRKTRIEPGAYVRLMVDSGVMMSDTPFERRTNTDVVRKSHGDVCITGLGLGMILDPIAAKDDVRSITVVERDPDVIAIVGAHYQDHPKVRIVQGDAETWKPLAGTTFQTVYHDIWPTVTADNKPQMTRLKRRFAHWMDRADPHAWQGCWMERDVQDLARESQRMREHRRFMRGVGATTRTSDGIDLV